MAERSRTLLAEVLLESGGGAWTPLAGDVESPQGLTRYADAGVLYRNVVLTSPECLWRWTAKECWVVSRQALVKPLTTWSVGVGTFKMWLLVWSHR